MADIILKDFNAIEQTYEGVEKVKFNTSDGGTQVFSAGEAVDDVEISLDFKNGDQRVSATEGSLVKSAIIRKPDELIPENIAKGITIAGIEGTCESADERIKYVTFMNGQTKLTNYPVIVGDTCRDVVERGIIERPTKDSTERYEYTFGGWSLTDDGTVDEGALTNVTEDRTVYLVFIETPRKYLVRFYDGDTVLSEQEVEYGKQATPPEVTKEGYKLKGWSSSDFTITKNTDFYAYWVEEFSTASWATIIEKVNDGTASTIWSEGETKDLRLNYEDGTSETITVRIAALPPNKYVYMEDGAAAKICIVAAQPLTTLKPFANENSWFSDSNSEEKYKSQPIMSYLINDVFNALPIELQQSIRARNIEVYGSLKVPMKLWLPERSDTLTIWSSGFFANASDRIMTRRGDTTPIEWYCGDYGYSNGVSMYSIVVDTSGNVKKTIGYFYSTDGTKERGVVFGFCL